MSPSEQEHIAQEQVRPVAGTTAVEAAKDAGGASAFLDLYLSPAEGFLALSRRARFWVPILLLSAIQIVFTAIWVHKMEPREFMKAQLEESGQIDKIPPDRQEAILEQQAKFVPVIGWVGAFVGPALIILVVAGVYYVVLRFVLESEIGFRPAATVVGYAFLATAVVQVPLMLLVLALKGDWSVAPQTVLQTSAAVLMNRASVAKPLWVLAQSLDLFTLWLLWLCYKGFRVTTHLGAGAVAAAVLVPWIVVVLLKVGLAVIF
jgi:hypothetical protein